MRAGSPRLTLLVPGLLASMPGVDARAVVDRHCPQLSKLLGRAHRAVEHADADMLGYRLLGYALSETHDPPAAWLSYQFDAGKVAPGPILRADPVHLRADQSRLLLFDAGRLNIGDDEAHALEAAFNAHFGADGLRLELSTPTRGYLHLSAQPALRTTPLEQAVGRNVDACLPRGPDAQYWHRVLNEVQMLFHEHPVNRAREARGQPLINSLWLWGGGRPLTAAASDWQHLWSDDPALRALAWLNGIHGSEPAARFATWTSDVVGGRHLVILDALRRPFAYADADSWFSGIERLERDWFAPAVEALRRGTLQELQLYPDDGRVYRASRWTLLRFWKRWRPPRAEQHTHTH